MNDTLPKKNEIAFGDKRLPDRVPAPMISVVGLQNKKMNNEIHIAHGDSAGGTIRLSINPKPGNLLVNLDPVSYGPLVAFNSVEEWRLTRESYFNPIFFELYDSPLEEHEYDILLNTEKIKRADKVILWLGSGLEEQILLVWVVQLFKIISADIEKLRVIQFFKEPNKGFEVVSIGVLNPDQLLAHPTPRTLSNEEIQYMAKVWDVLTASKPDALMGLINDKPQGTLNLLHRSLKYLLGRFPHYITGLTYWDNELLKYTRTKGPKAVRVIGYTMGYSTDNLDSVGDLLLYYRLRRLGDKSLKKQVVTLTGNSPRMRDTEVHLTEFGQNVLDGQANLVEINGIDEWIGGIHLQSKTNEVWYRKDDTLVKAKL